MSRSDRFAALRGLAVLLAAALLFSLLAIACNGDNGDGTTPQPDETPAADEGDADGDGTDGDGDGTDGDGTDGDGTDGDGTDGDGADSGDPAVSDVRVYSGDQER